MESPETVTEAMQLLERDGYTSSFEIRDGLVSCEACSTDHSHAQLLVERTYRFEGESDPGDEAIVLGVKCPGCGMHGVLVSAYGPDADRELIALVRHING